MQIKKNKIKELGVILRKAPKKIAENFFLAIFMFLLIIFMLGGLIFYKYDILAQQKKIEISADILKFREDVYQKILIVWLEREEKFNKSSEKEYLNPFKVPAPELTE